MGTASAPSTSTQAKPDAHPAGPILLTTKLHFPEPRPELVPRPDLVARLDVRPRPRLALLSAPPGAGKTTLLSAWRAAGGERSFAWIGLDPADNDPVRFWTYVVEALRRAAGRAEIGRAALHVLHAPGTSILTDFLPRLVNEVTSLDRELALVIDDYHLVTSAAVHESLTSLIEHAPPALGVVLAARSDPPLPLGRLRVRGELLELREADLSFALTEVRALLNDVLGLGLGDDELELLLERTEGWPAGVYLAALSLRARDDRPAFLSEFAGDDRHVVDYLGAEVMAAQPPGVREFLLRTSVLERLTGPLCDAVTGGAGSDRLLETIERANLFLVPLDDKRAWYRYHHLFGELLGHELERAEPEGVPALHRRAARWHLGAGLVSDGIRHTIAAGDVADAAELIAAHWAPTLLGGAGGDRAVEAWLDALPDEAVRGDVRLCVARCYVGQSTGRLDLSARWLAIAESAPQPGPFRDGFGSKRGAIACVRAGLLILSGDVAGALEAARVVLSEEAEGSPWRGIGYGAAALAHCGLGEWREARQCASRWVEIGRAAGQRIPQVSGLGQCAAFEAELGRWQAVEGQAQAALELSGQGGLEEHWVSGFAHLARGLALEQRGRLDSGRREITRAVELGRRGAGPIVTTWMLVHLARVDPGRARDHLAEARALLAAAPDAGTIPRRLAAAERRHGIHRPAAATGEPLSKRERDVLRLLPTPLSQREIAAELYVSLNTVKSHVKSILRKLDAHNRDDAVGRARERGLL
jgi:LuxR family transcriptional regulator, maltose regulon positive regulatory protein